MHNCARQGITTFLQSEVNLHVRCFFDVGSCHITVPQRCEAGMKARQMPTVLNFGVWLLLAIESSHAHWLILGRLNHDTAADSTLFAKNLL